MSHRHSRWIHTDNVKVRATGAIGGGAGRARKVWKSFREVVVTDCEGLATQPWATECSLEGKERFSSLSWP